MKLRHLVAALSLGMLTGALAAPAMAQDIRWDGNVIFNNNPNGCNDAATGGFLETGVLTSTFTHNRFVDPMLVNPASLTSPDFRPQAGSNVLCGVHPVIALPVDGFFDQVNYAGALPPAAGESWLRGTWASYSQNGNPAEFNLARPLVTLSGVLPASYTMSSANNYLLQGRVTVPAGGVLMIQPGTTVFGSTTVSPSFLEVTRGGRLICNGRPNQPIIFTSELAAGGTAQPGDWGGVVWNGAACANCAATDLGQSCTSEGSADTLYFGGTDDHYNGGSMTWTRIEFSGFQFAPNNELNCLTMNALGDQTLIDYVQAHRGSDDLFEWFGGTVRHKFLLGTQGGDDGLDFQMGYRGKVQFAIIQQGPFTGVDKGIEGDNNEFNFANNLCRSDPTFANVTFVGTRTTDGAGTTFGSGGIHLRRGARGEVLNSIVLGFRLCGFDFDDAETVGGGFGPDGVPACPTARGGQRRHLGRQRHLRQQPQRVQRRATGGFLENSVLFGAPFTHNRQVDPALTAAASLTSPSFVPTTASGALCANFHPVVRVRQDGFFDQTDYSGALSNDPARDWTTGWTTFDQNGNPGDFNLARPLVVLSGVLPDGYVFSNDSNYLLQGRVTVASGNVAVIQAGTAIFGSTTVTPSYLDVTRGGRLYANGTRTHPIVFTSENASAGLAAPGDWGGIVWNGAACANCAATDIGQSCTSEGSADTLYFGGANDEYNGGSLGFARVEFSGFQFAPNNELNCLTMNALGSQTSVSWIQTHKGSDDLFEWFGGNVNGKYLLGTQGGDDGLDFQMGYRGRVQYSIIQQGPFTGVDKGIEGDNNEFNFANSLCRSNPTFANLTFVGTRVTDGPATTFGAQGIHFRRGARGEVLNSIVLGFRLCGFDFDDAETVAGGFGPDGVTSCSVTSGVIAGGGAGSSPLSVRAFPNPFRSASRISFTLPAGGRTRVQVFTLSGQLVETLADDDLTAGGHELEWQAPSQLADGLYFYTVESGRYSATGKLIRVQ